MTDTRRRRWSKRTLRGVAWLAGGAAFAAPLASLTVSPKPTDAPGEPGRRVVVVRTITRRVVVQPAPSTPQVRYVYVDGGGSSTTSGGTTSGGTTSGATTAAAPAPATTTGGS